MCRLPWVIPAQYVIPKYHDLAHFIGRKMSETILGKIKPPSVGVSFSCVITINSILKIVSF